MARLARFIVPGIPHHITQRGNQPTFFCDADYAVYRDLLAEVETSLGRDPRPAKRGRKPRTGEE